MTMIPESEAVITFHARHLPLSHYHIPIMPGPANEKGRKKRLNKKQKAKKNESSETMTNPVAHLEVLVQTPPESVSRVDEKNPIQNAKPTPPEDSRRTYTSFSHSRDDRIDEAYTPMGYGYAEDPDDNVSVYDPDARVSHLEASSSYIYDPGNGPRVRDFMAFLKSPFAAPAVQSFLHVGADPQVVHQEERYTAANIIPILNRFLPGEFATVRAHPINSPTNTSYLIPKNIL